MTREERKKLQKKYDRNTILTFVFIGLFILEFVLMLSGVIPPLKNPHMWNVVPLVMLFISPIFIALFIHVSNQTVGYEIDKYQKELYKKRDKIRLGIVWDRVKKHQVNEAREISINEKYFKSLDYQQFCNGIVIGAAQIHGGYDTWKKAPNIIMEDIINPSLE